MAVTKRLSDFHGRDNNFNLIRMVAALLVIEAHACAVTDRHELLRPVLGLGGGDLGVDIFFVLSGYLIAKSWAGKTWAEFAWARIMRIYPALWVSTVLSVVLVGLFFCREPAVNFLTRTSTLGYLWHNATMLPHFAGQTTLPGAFGSTGRDFNISLWTLPYELQMYMLLALVGVTVGARARYMATLALGGGAIVLTGHFFGIRQIDIGRFLYFFFSGAFAFALRDRIALSGWLAAALAAGVVASLLLKPVWRETAFDVALPYLVLWCAYIPSGSIRLWNKLGDYSYGSYIFAHPIQMGLAELGLTDHWWSNMVFSVAIILPLAALSWHTLEKRALGVLPPRWILHFSE